MLGIVTVLLRNQCYWVKNIIISSCSAFLSSCAGVAVPREPFARSVCR